MPVYEYYCSECRTSFEALRSMAALNEPQTCAGCGGTDHVNRKLTTFARVTGVSGDVELGGSSQPMFGGGGCGCGGACSCGH